MSDSFWFESKKVIYQPLQIQYTHIPFFIYFQNHSDLFQVTPAFVSNFWFKGIFALLYNCWKCIQVLDIEYISVSLDY